MRPKTLVAVFLVVNGSSALATLGELEPSIAKDAVQLKATSSAKPIQDKASGPRYHEIKNSRATVKEYVNDSGRVYAVTWTGNQHPDLEVLFGASYKEFADEQKANRFQNKFARITTTKSKNVIVKLIGYQNNMRGLAYLPALVPPGVNILELE